MKDLRLMTGLSFMLTLLLFNCNTPSHLLQEGEYDEAVYEAIKNLRNSRKKKEKDIIVVEEAFRRITSNDMRRIADLEAEGQAINWIKINELHNNIKDRQDLITPYLPLVATKTGYKADFRFVKIRPLELESRKKAAEYYYNTGRRDLEDARKGNKGSARTAHRKFTRVNNYFNSFKDANKLKDEAYELGLDKVILEMRNSSFAFIPRGFEEELLAFNERNLDDFWTYYYNPNNAPVDVDYKVIVDITDIDVSPERFHEKAYTVEKTLTKTVRKKVTRNNTNPNNTTRPNKGRNTTREVKPVFAVSDTTRNVRPVTVKPEVEYVNVEVPFTVFADVIDVFQTKSAFVKARVSFYDASSKALIESDYVNATIDFENIASTFNGDRRALPAAVINRLGGSPTRFPTDSELVFDAAKQLKSEVGHIIKGSEPYVMR